MIPLAKTLLLTASLSLGSQTAEQATVVVVVGAPGSPEYGEQFRQWADRWQLAAKQAGAKYLNIGDGPTGETPDRGRLEELLSRERKESTDPLWLVLIGHGTFDGQAAKFNLRGPDVAAAELAEWLAPYKRPLAVINCASSSAPFINRLSAPNRAIVTATTSGYEQNYARFGDYFSSAIVDVAADLDKDDQTSLLEAFLSASRRVTEFYQFEARLATETALVDDNGDGRGTPAAWFRGIRAIRRAKDGASSDGLRAHQFHLIRSRQEQEMSAEARTRRDELELAVAKLRDSKSDSMTEAEQDAYYAKLEPLLLELARLYERPETSAAERVTVPK